MDILAIYLLLLEKGNHSFEDHPRDFLTHYPDHPLCVFYNTSFNEWLKVHLPIKGSRRSFAQYVEWVLVQCDSLLTACPNEEDIASPTPAPEPSQPSAIPAAKQPEPTTDSETEPTTKQKPNVRQRLFTSRSLSLTSRCLSRFEDRIHHAGMDGLLRNCATGCRVDEAFTMDDLVDSMSADTSGLRCGRVQLRIVFITPSTRSLLILQGCVVVVSWHRSLVSAGNGPDPGFNELDEEISAGLQSQMVPSSSKSSLSLLVQPSSKLSSPLQCRSESSSSLLVKPSSKSSQSSLVKPIYKSSSSPLVKPIYKSSHSSLVKPSSKSSSSPLVQPSSKSSSSTLVQPSTKSLPSSTKFLPSSTKSSSSSIKSPSSPLALPSSKSPSSQNILPSLPLPPLLP
ncbi:hypothetical protein DPX16_23366 [Anabarilius grahami]|uniref:Uncharacterized protein n=1 Tax=Anabarilius grahami TaxID=495550 RepID=A0A3N0Y1C3_ANAGA|nr:hypothetical protein DPX16_23366 [Anabarilius grahami]